VPKDWIAKYKGKFDQGWDKLREETFARQKKLGVIPPDCELTKRPEDIPAWDKMDAAASGARARDGDLCGVPRVSPTTTSAASSIRCGAGILDDTLIYYIIGDNGASAEGSLIGAWNDKAARRRPTSPRPSS
jgi:arylsulfatase